MHTPFSFLCGEEVGEVDILQFEVKALMEKHKNKLKRINELGDEVGWGGGGGKSRENWWFVRATTRVHPHSNKICRCGTLSYLQGKNIHLVVN